MKVPLEILFIIVLIALGWRQPYRHHIGRILGEPQPAAFTRPPANGGRTLPAPTPAPDRSWLWQPGKLDPGAH